MELLRDYNATAHLYDKRYRDEQIPKINFLLDKLRPKEGDILLDVGCGTGLLFERVSCRLILGVDISINMLREAKKRAREGAGSKQNPFGKIKDVELILADAEFLPIRSGSMDIVVSITALQLAGDQDRAIYEMLRVLKDQGSFGISIIKKASIPKGLPNGTEVYDMEEIKDVFCVGRKER
ncbi:MAG: methyltransferase domain-containing protein [Candidatus Methanomethyliaceae archaeon]|nr:methyltransferase domain-containing protein [Candidatus Methanomethyliaceae archaeon]